MVVFGWKMFKIGDFQEFQNFRFLAPLTTQFRVFWCSDEFFVALHHSKTIIDWIQPS